MENSCNKNLNKSKFILIKYKLLPILVRFNIIYIHIFTIFFLLTTR
jgi:hypothetical protein